MHACQRPGAWKTSPRASIPMPAPDRNRSIAPAKHSRPRPNRLTHPPPRRMAHPPSRSTHANSPMRSAKATWPAPPMRCEASTAGTTRCSPSNARLSPANWRIWPAKPSRLRRSPALPRHHRLHPRLRPQRQHSRLRSPPRPSPSPPRRQPRRNRVPRPIAPRSISCAMPCATRPARCAPIRLRPPPSLRNAATLQIKNPKHRSRERAIAHRHNRHRHSQRSRTHPLARVSSPRASRRATPRPRPSPAHRKTPGRLLLHHNANLMRPTTTRRTRAQRKERLSHVRRNPHPVLLPSRPCSRIGRTGHPRLNLQATPPRSPRPRGRNRRLNLRSNHLHNSHPPSPTSRHRLLLRRTHRHSRLHANHHHNPRRHRRMNRRTRKAKSNRTPPRSAVPSASCATSRTSPAMPKNNSSNPSDCATWRARCRSR